MAMRFCVLLLLCQMSVAHRSDSGGGQIGLEDNDELTKTGCKNLIGRYLGTSSEDWMLSHHFEKYTWLKKDSVYKLLNDSLCSADEERKRAAIYCIRQAVDITVQQNATVAKCNALEAEELLQFIKCRQDLKNAGFQKQVDICLSGQYKHAEDIEACGRALQRTFQASPKKTIQDFILQKCQDNPEWHKSDEGKSLTHCVIDARKAFNKPGVAHQPAISPSNGPESNEALFQDCNAPGGIEKMDEKSQAAKKCKEGDVTWLQEYADGKLPELKGRKYHSGFGHFDTFEDMCSEARSDATDLGYVEKVAENAKKIRNCLDQDSMKVLDSISFSRLFHTGYDLCVKNDFDRDNAGKEAKDLSECLTLSKKGKGVDATPCYDTSISDNQARVWKPEGVAEARWRYKCMTDMIEAMKTLSQPDRYNRTDTPHVADDVQEAFGIDYIHSRLEDVARGYCARHDYDSEKVQQDVEPVVECLSKEFKTIDMKTECGDVYMIRARDQDRCDAKAATDEGHRLLCCAADQCGR